VTGGTGPGAEIWREARASGPMITWAVLRVVASVVVVTALYYLLPFDRSATGVVVTLLVAGLVVFVGLVAFQVRAITVSPFPGLRAIEALATSVPLFLALFAATYFVMARLSPGSFTAPLSGAAGSASRKTLTARASIEPIARAAITCDQPAARHRPEPCPGWRADLPSLP